MKYQVTYNNNNKTHYGDFEANNHIDLLKFFDLVVGAEVLEIREYVFEDINKNISISDLRNQNFIFKAYNEDNVLLDVKIPLIKRNLSESFITDFIKNNIKIKSKKIKSLTFSYKK